jgi:hypothetical protein
VIRVRVELLKLIPDAMLCTPVTFSHSPGTLKQQLGLTSAFRISRAYGPNYGGPLRLVSPIEELLGRNSSGSSLENRDYGRRDPLR